MTVAQHTRADVTLNVMSFTRHAIIYYILTRIVPVSHNIISKLDNPELDLRLESATAFDMPHLPTTLNSLGAAALAGIQLYAHSRRLGLTAAVAAQQPPRSDPTTTGRR